MSGADEELEDLLEAAFADGSDGQSAGEPGERGLAAEPSPKRAKTAKASCPPHPGFMGDICIRCGQLRPASLPAHVGAGSSGVGADTSGVALRYIHHSLEVTQDEAERVRAETEQRALAARRLLLVLDLDHTLLNSTHRSELTEEGQRILEAQVEREAAAAEEDAGAAAAVASGAAAAGGGDTPRQLELFQLEAVCMWTKLRPGVHAFLEAAHARFDLHVYTMGDKSYAVEMARLLDPTGRLFQGRVISSGDSTRRGLKDLDVVLGAEHMALVVDDTEAVWPRFRGNLVLVERYVFFPACARRFGSRQSLMELHSDEPAEGGALQATLRVLEAVHKRFFAPGAIPDVRVHLGALRREVLGPSCCLLFSRITPLGAADPQKHPLWRLATELGARCVLGIEDGITHVVASDVTEKTHWAVKHRKHVVSPEWLRRSSLTWARADEAQFPVVATEKKAPVEKAADPS